MNEILDEKKEHEHFIREMVIRLKSDKETIKQL